MNMSTNVIFSQSLVELFAGELREPEVDGRKSGEDRAPEQHVAEVGDDEVRVVERRNQPQLVLPRK